MLINMYLINLYAFKIKCDEYFYRKQIKIKFF